MKRFILVLFLLSAMFMASAEVLDKIVAKIGGDIILLSDLEKHSAQMQSAGVDVTKLDQRTILDGMIEQKLMIQKAKDLNIKVDDARIKGYAERYIRNIRAQYPSEAAFLSDLAKMRLTQSDLLNYFIDQLTENALTEQLVEKYISSKVKLEDQEMRAYFEASKDSMAVKPLSWELRMIMREVKPSTASEAAKLDSINAILTRLRSGEDFASLASQYSDCPSGAQGGDLGFLKRGMMVKPFEDAAFQLAVGEVSEVVQTQFGYHIIKMEEKKGEEIRVRHILKMLS
ncbi:MAG TPA: peptidylprolyl isomerase, partial [Candidatus Cloacimonadota bacterium]|nr:peptidylprolyl isomerase [Candidatus Cloacimonadota bacterium]